MSKARDSVFVVKSKKGFLARTALLDAALYLIAERGMHGFSIGQLCDRAGLKRTSFYTYYDTLEELVDELSERETLAFGERFKSTYGYMPAGARRFFVNIIGFFRIASEDDTWNRFVMSLMSGHEKTIRRDTRLVDADIAAAIASGDFAIPEAHAAALRNMLFSSFMHIRTDEFKQDPAAYVVIVCDLLLDAAQASAETRTMVAAFLQTQDAV